MLVFQSQMHCKSTVDEISCAPKHYHNKLGMMRTSTNWTITQRHQCFIILLFFLTTASLVNISEAGLACLSNPCVYGVCIDDLNSTYSCYCIDGYTGVHCQTNWDECWSSPCLHGGTCIDGIASYNCSCPDGFLGVDCEENYNECQSNPCQNGGFCHDEENAFFCNCAQGYDGDFCEIDVAVCNTGDRCHNGAICVEGPGLEYSCRCTEGYEGQLCDAETNECASAPCQNGAICIDKFASYVCACSMGFGGTNCEEEIMICADSPCANQALCLMEEQSPTCYCVPDYHGERCELQYDECQLNVERCANGGTCVDGIDDFFCTCAPNFSGVNCECLVFEEEGQISMDCNSTFPSNEVSVPTATQSLGSKTEIVWESSTTVDNNQTSPLASFTVQYTDEYWKSSSKASFDTEKMSYSSNILSTASIAYATDTTSITDGRITEDVPIYSAKPKDNTPKMVTASFDVQNMNTILPASLPIEDITADITSKEYVTKLTPSYGPPEYTTHLPYEGSTTYSVENVDQSDRDGKEATKASAWDSFFTAIPTNISIYATSQGKNQDTNHGFPTTNIFKPNLETSTPFPGKSIDFGSSETPINTVEITRPPSLMQKCDSTVCRNGGTCTMSSNGVRCMCIFQYVGPFCNIAVRIQNAAFSKDSFLRHIIYRRENSTYTEGLQMHILEQTAAIVVRFNAKLTSRDGLILLASAEGEEGYHYVALFLHNGLLQFQFSCGLQTMLLSEIEGTINNGSELKIKVQLNFNDKYSHCNASLHLNETLAMSGAQPTWLANVDSILQHKHTKTLSPIRQIWLHLGGRPFKTMYTQNHNISRYHGFTGCINELEINNLPSGIFDDAEDAYKIYECTSLACLSNPCNNGGVCMENDTGELERLGITIRDDALDTWSCKCAFGYMGKTCEKTICDNNPCQFGGTCVTFPQSGYLCMCPYGKHGHFCEHDLDILQPSFFGSIKGISSYVAYPIAFPLEDSFEFSFKIIPTTASQISLLAFIGQFSHHHDRSDHFAVSFIQGFILVTWNLGSGPRRIFTQEPIQVQPTRPTTIQVGRTGRTAWLSIDGKVNISGNSPGTSTKLNVTSLLFIGGHERVNFSSLPHDLPLHSGFQGCIFDTRLIAGPLKIPLQHIGGMRGRSVGQCGTKECHRHACQNNGACLQHGSTFTCICKEDWNGILCSENVNPCDETYRRCSGPDVSCFPLISGYECDCPFGKVGKHCETDIKHLSDVSFSGRRSYLALQWQTHRLPDDRENEVRYENIVHHSQIIPHNHSILLKSIHELDKINDLLKVQPMLNNTGIYTVDHERIPRLEQYRKLTTRHMSIELQLRPLSEKGLIMFVQTFINSNAQQQGFVSLSLQGGVVEYRVSSGHGQTSVVRSNHVMAIGEWHTIRVVKFGKRLTLWVEGKGTSIIGSDSEEFVNPSSKIYLGGLADLSKLPFDAISGYPWPFRGCIRGVSLNGTRIILNQSSIVASRNIDDCDGTPCGGDICIDGGLCWLDDHSKPHCKCPEHSKGAKCDIRESCKTVQCHNNGHCMTNGKCSCAVGWSGHYCEMATSKYSSIGFNDGSYILIPSQKIKMKDKRNEESGLVGAKSWLEIQISFNFSSLEDGLLLWTTDTMNRYFGVGIRDGFLVFASNIAVFAENGMKIDNARNAFVADGDWHNMLLVTKANHMQISVDGLRLFTGIIQESVTSHLRSTYDERIVPDEITYLGGLPDDNIQNRTHGNFIKSFNGCMQQIFMGNRMDQLDVAAYEGVNINECPV